jgi:hypothetical protein
VFDSALPRAFWITKAEIPLENHKFCFVLVSPHVKRATPVSERKFGWNGGDGTCFEPLQRLGCDPEAGQSGGLFTPVGCHTWRATGITIYLENDGRLEHAQQMAGHESPRTTKLYDRTKDEITLSEVERIRL